MRLRVAVVVVTAALLGAGTAAGAGRSSVAALQVALRAKRVYAGEIDGVLGPDTRAAVMRFQRRAGLVVDGVVGPRTRRALGRRWRPSLGSRPLRRRAIGWDVAQLQFKLAWHGFPSGNFDGVFGPRTDVAVRNFQLFAGLAADGIAGPATLAALRSPLPRSPISVAWPISGAVSSGFGPRGIRFHAGIDIPTPRGTPVGAAASGTVTFADWNNGFGKLVVIAHGSGVETYYAHLSRIGVGPGEDVSTGEGIGRVGSTGHSTGPHLHFEVHVRGAAIDPLTALG